MAGYMLIDYYNFICFLCYYVYYTSLQTYPYYKGDVYGAI